VNGNVQRLADLLGNFGANVQQGQILDVRSSLGKEELTPAVTANAYKRGAKFVDVWYWDPHLNLETVFYDTLLDENAASHMALGTSYDAAVSDADRKRLNRSSIHVDFMVGSPEVEVTGITREGDRVPVLRDAAWQI
jgi:leucyl aminopeptidase (aminopeptidase T)